MADLASLTVDDFRDCVGESFTLSDGARYELVSAEARPDPNAPREPFSLIFAGPPGVVRPQGICALEHAELGTLEIFLVPIAQDAQAVRYQAIFA